MINQAFVFLKPHISENKQVLNFVLDLFEKNHIEIKVQGEICSSEIKEKNLIDKHYAINAKVGTIKQPAQLFLNKQAEKKFLDEFSITWQDALKKEQIISGLQMQNKLKCTGDELIEKWRNNGAIKIRGGIYVSYFKNENKYVLNGFYPSIREVFTAKCAKIIYFVVDFSSNKLNWHSFRDNIIGSTDPAKADKNSIRGYFSNHNKEYNIQTSYRDNIIHASASPFEAFIEKQNWLVDFDLSQDPLFNVLPTTTIKDLYDHNPVLYKNEKNQLVKLKDKNNNSTKISLINYLEDKDTDKVIDLLKNITNFA